MLRAKLFLQQQDEDEWQVPTKDDFRLARIAYQVACLEWAVRTMLATNPKPPPFKEKDFLLKFKARRKKVREVVEPPLTDAEREVVARQRAVEMFAPMMKALGADPVTPPGG